LLLLFLELGGYYLNAVQLHVHAADVLVRRGMHREGSYGNPTDRLGLDVFTLGERHSSEILTPAFEGTPGHGV
jgi:hypothetical protein